MLSGGIFNVFGDYFFVFTCDMGAFGAGLATAIGTVISILVMLTHFVRKRNTLRLVRPTQLRRKYREICVTGFSTFFIDIAMGILTILFNRQIMAYLGTDALSVYGVIVNVSTFVQCCAYSVGQASQPIFSTNLGAGKWARIRQTLRYAVITTVCFGLFWTALCLIAPQRFHPPVHVADGGRAAHRPGHHPVLRPVLPAAAAEHLLHLLLPVGDETPGRLCGLHPARPGDQRRAHPPAARGRRGRTPSGWPCR